MVAVAVVFMTSSPATSAKLFDEPAVAAALLLPYLNIPEHNSYYFSKLYF